MTARATSLAASGTFAPPAHSAEGRAHVAGVARAVEPLRGISDRVQLVYVPLTKDQGASDVLSELLLLGGSLHMLAATGAGVDPKPEAVARVNRVAQESTQAILSQMWRQPAAEGYLVANSALIQSVLWLADWDSRRSRSVALVNTSWTTAARSIAIAFPEASRALVVAAVGNDPTAIVHHSPLISLAGRSAQEASVVAVMTLNRNGDADCWTSQIDTANPSAVDGSTGYLGGIPDGLCASSLAAPRVAWFLAARETLRPAPVEHPLAWLADVRRSLHASRSGTLPRDVLFDPVHYVRP